MIGIATILPEPYFQFVVDLQEGIKAQLNLGDVPEMGIPHISFHIAPAYDLTKVAAILAAVSSQTKPVTVQTTGLAVFSGDEPVIYIPVTQNADLTALHSQLWPELEACAQDAPAYYAPSNWFPHITLCHTGITPESVGKTIQWLNKQDTTWQIPLTNLTILYDDDSLAPLSRYDFELCQILE
ncbi:MAG: 2'-5' RNA ligase family protein [Chloroflexi bacterium]|nr:2'-5' RNA ligase family protein [Chloroflexota bacterium]